MHYHTNYYYPVTCCIQHKVHKPQKLLDVHQILFLVKGWGLGTRVLIADSFSHAFCFT